MAPKKNRLFDVTELHRSLTAGGDEPLRHKTTLRRVRTAPFKFH